MEEWVIISIPTKILYLLLNLGNDEVLTSASIALQNSLSSLSKIHLYFYQFICHIYLFIMGKICSVEEKHSMQCKR